MERMASTPEVVRVRQNKMFQHEAISQICLNIFASNVAHLFSTQFSTNTLLHAVFTWT